MTGLADENHQNDREINERETAMITRSVEEAANSHQNQLENFRQKNFQAIKNVATKFTPTHPHLLPEKSQLALYQDDLSLAYQLRIHNS